MSLDAARRSACATARAVFLLSENRQADRGKPKLVKQTTDNDRLSYALTIVPRRCSHWTRNWESFMGGPGPVAS